MLLEDGSVGLFDWGLSGELTEVDKRFVASVMRAVISLDLDSLIDALKVYAENTSEIELEDDSVREELKRFIELAKTTSGSEDQKDKKKPRLDELFDAAIEGAQRLGINVPKGLILMAKSLITIEGLAKGIDPDVSLKYVAAPVLLRVAKPRVKDFMSLGKTLSQKNSSFNKKRLQAPT